MAMAHLMQTKADDLFASAKAVPDLDLLISKYGDAMLRMCYLYLKDFHLAQDAVQDTFIRAYRGYSGFKGLSEEKTWITKIAINVCKNYLRNPWRKIVYPESALENLPADHDGGIHTDDTLIVSIKKLKPKYKEAILLCYYQEMSIKEISETLRIPMGTVSVRLKRAREILKTDLEGWYFGDE